MESNIRRKQYPDIFQSFSITAHQFHLQVAQKITLIRVRIHSSKIFFTSSPEHEYREINISKKGSLMLSTSLSRRVALHC